MNRFYLRLLWVCVFGGTLSLMGCQNTSASLSPKDYMYLMRYDRQSGNSYIDQYSVSTDQKIESFDSDDDVTYLSKMPNGRIWCTYHENFDGRHQTAKELNPVTGKIRRLFDHPSLSADEAIDLGDKVYIRFESIKATDDYIKQNPGSVPYNDAGFEVYKKTDKGLVLESFIRLDMDSFILDISMSDDRKFLYGSVDPLDLSPVGAPVEKRISNLDKHAWIAEINTQTNTIDRFISMDPYLRSIWGIEVVGDYIYVTALEKETFTEDVEIDRIKLTDQTPAALSQRKGKPYIPTYSAEIRDYNRSLFVFNRNPFKLVKKIPIEAMGRRMAVDRDAKRLFVLHEGGIGSRLGLITMIDLETHTRIGQLEVPRIRMIEYAGNHRLYVTTSRELLILDTRSFEVIKKVPGEFGMIAGQW